MSRMDELVTPNAEAYITAEEFARRTQALHDAVYPMPCSMCGRRDEEHRPHELSDGHTIVTGCYCRCGNYKGPAIATPMENYRARIACVAAPRGPRARQQEHGPESAGAIASALVPPRPATPTHVAEIASALDRERPRSALSPERRFAFLAACAGLGCDEHRIRCELAAYGEELEECSEEASKAVFRALKSESAPGPAQAPTRTTIPAAATTPCGAPVGVGVTTDTRPASPQPAPGLIVGTDVAERGES